ncbi:MAG: glycosyltransferase family 39 protein [Acidobacteriota bacterium]
MARALFAALVVGYLPGLLLFRAPVGNRPLRAALPAEERAFWAVLLSLTGSLLIVLALAGLGRYSFPRLLGADLALSACIAIVWRGRLRLGTKAPPPGWTTLIPIGLVTLGLWMYFPPAEYVIGGKDPGTYINEGIEIAQRGALVIRDPVVASIPPAFRDLFFPPHLDQQRWYYGLRFMGFFIQDPAAGSVIGQFPHLFPASIAIGYGIDGLSGARKTVGVWAILGLLAVYFAGARIFGRTVAAFAVGLLAINVAEVWFARYPNSEVMMQALLFAALLAFARAMDGSRGFFGAISGLLLGLMLFLRYEVILAFATFGAAAALAPVLRKRVGVTFGVTLVLAGVAGLWYLAGPLKAYSAYPLGFTRDQGGWWIVGAGVAGAGIFRRLLRREVVARAVQRFLPPLLAVTLVALAVYAYFFRQEGGRTALADAMAFRTFGWYLTPWVLGVAVVGVGVVTTRRFWRDPAFFLTFAIFSVFFFYKTRIVPEHFWAARRFLAVPLPGALLLVAALSSEVVRSCLTWFAGRRNREALDPPTGNRGWLPPLETALIAATMIPVALVFWSASTPVRGHVEYAGMIPHLEQLAARVGDRDLLIVESRNAGSDLHVLAVPLAYIYARNVLVLDSPVPPKRTFEDFVTWARSQYANVLFLGGGGTDLLTRHVTATPIVSDRFDVPEYESPTNAYPSGPRRKDFEFGLYRLLPTEAAPAADIDLTIGTLDDLNVVRFHAKETRSESGTVFRWTGALSYVLLLGMSPDTHEVTIWMSNGGRPAAKAPPARVEVSLAERVLGTATPIDAVRPYTFAIPADVAAAAAASQDPVRLQLRVPTWNPAALIGGNDTRDLGVMVTRVQTR